MPYMTLSEAEKYILKQSTNGIPIILCSRSQRIMKALDRAGYVEVSLNEKLSMSLIQYGLDIRDSKVLHELKRIIEESGSAVILTDYEMLFNPSYKLDVMKAFCDIARTKRFAVEWCGQSTSETLEYAEPGYQDYQKYDIAKYAIICVK